VLEKGVVLFNGSMRHAGETYGEDSLFAWKHPLKRGYTVNALTHGLSNVITCVDLLEVLHSPQFHLETRQVRLKLTCGITCQTVRACYRVFLVAVEMNDFYAGVHTVRTEMDHVEKNDKSLDPLLQVFRRFWIEYNPSDRTVKHAAHVLEVIKRRKALFQRRNVASANRNQQMVAIITAIFATAGFQNADFAHAVVKKERMTLTDLLKCSTLQFYNMGLSMGDSQRLTDFRMSKGDTNENVSL